MARQHVLAKNQVSRTNELDVAGERRVIQALRHFWHPVAHSFERWGVRRHRHLPPRAPAP